MQNGRLRSETGVLANFMITVTIGTYPYATGNFPKSPPNIRKPSYFSTVTFTENEFLKSSLQSIFPENITISALIYKILLVARITPLYALILLFFVPSEVPFYANRFVVLYLK
jgi:hypothetical protein